MADSPPQIRAVRPHTKSKGGCRSCKIRKVKCSETRPSCTSCLRRKEPCEYDTERIRFRHVDVAERHNASSPSTATAASPTPPTPVPVPAMNSPSSPYSSVEDFSSRVTVESTERRLLELRLMHHFTSSTVHGGFPSAHNEDMLQMWWKVAPALSFKHPFLLNIIISIAALHITKIDPELNAEMADTHRIYFNAATSGLRQAVRDLSAENAEAICISNILIALPSFILLQKSDVGCYSPPLQLFSLLAQTIPLFTAAWPLLPQSSKVYAFSEAKPNIMDFKEETSKEIYRRPFASLLSWRAAGEVVDKESQEAYEFALGYVGCILANIEDKVEASVLRRMLQSFPSVVPWIFVERLKERNLRALTILAYYFSLAKAMDNVWWMRGIAEREVFGVQSIIPEEWQWAMAWPLQKMATFAAWSMPPIQGPRQ